MKLSRNDWSDMTNTPRLEAVFEKRNKEYGAYEIRSKYERSVVIAMLYAIGILMLVFIIPLLKNLMNNDSIVFTEPKNDVITFTDVITEVLQVEPAKPVKEISTKATIENAFKVVRDKDALDKPLTDIPLAASSGASGTIDVFTGNAGTGTTFTTAPSVPDTFVVVEEMPIFPGGEGKFMEYLQKSIRYPSIARENRISGKVFIRFIVDQEGKIGGASVVRSIGGGCDEEALRAINSMPAWRPGRQNGREVCVQFVLPVSFSLKD
jgi:periplasmic protein TonB